MYCKGFFRFFLLQLSSVKHFPPALKQASPHESSATGKFPYPEERILLPLSDWQVGHKKSTKKNGLNPFPLVLSLFILVIVA
jgi:hypothetical protein